MTPIKGKIRHAVQRGKQGRGLAAIILGLIFAGVGIGVAAFSVAPNLYDWVRMQQWEHVPADLLHVELKQSHSDNSTTYQVVARYQYHYQGRVYTGKRVGISGGSDNIGSWQRDAYNALRGGRPRVWVNPSKPTEAIYNRNMRWGLLGFKMIFVVVFGGIGIGVLWFGSRQRRPQPAGMPPWLAESNWRNNQIRSNAKTSLWFAWGFAVLWNAISLPGVFVLPGELAKGNNMAWLIMLFPLVGAGIIAFALKKTMEWRRFGPTKLTLDPFPGSIGGDVGGYVELRLPFNPSYKFSAVLTCAHVYTTRSGKETRTREDIIWQDAQAARIETGLRGTRLRFLFRTPVELPDSGEPSNDYHKWSLHISANLPGADLDRAFEIPVFSNGQPKTASFGTAELPGREAAAMPSLPANIIRIGHAGGGLELFYPLFRSARVAVVLFITGLLFLGIPGFFVLASTSNGPPMLLLGVFGLVGILLLLGGLYMLGNTLRVIISPRGLTTTRRVFGIPFSSYVALGEIQGVEKSVGVQTSGGGRSRASYRIHVITSAGKKITVGDSLPSASDADHVIGLIQQAGGLESLPQAFQPSKQLPKTTHSLKHKAAAEKKVRLIQIVTNILAVGFLIYFLYQFSNGFTKFF